MADVDKNLDVTTVTDTQEVQDLLAVMQSPENSSLFELFTSYVEERARQANDSTRIFKGTQLSDPRVYLQCPNSPTANNYRQAVYHFKTASQILQKYEKDKVDDLKDCELLRPVFENIVYGHICENSMFAFFCSTENTPILINQYLMLKPDDIFAEYAQYIILWRIVSKAKKKKNLLSDFESAKKHIKTAELLAFKLSKNVDCQPCHRIILIDLYYDLGSKYVSTGQPERALDSYQKCFELDISNYSALYGIAYMHMQSDPEKAIELFKKFINMAPECEKQYPNAYYMIASLYLLNENLDEVLRYCSLAEDAEKKRLPFLGPVDVPQKIALNHTRNVIKKMKS
ncbi:unnamed protein product [Mytilus coruscus]|uniref:Uncharacterized protein n=1 Tax=Mytilus coruscus TaxID=42192 RepID=A0A6J8E741_MYTCO|nr:unnamed protein product [Mytilus coruscus]